MLRTQEWGMQSDGQPRIRPKFPPKLRRHDPGALNPPAQGRGGGVVGDGAGPEAPAARSMRSRTPGANSRRRAPSPAR